MISGWRGGCPDEGAGRAGMIDEDQLPEPALGRGRRSDEIRVRAAHTDTTPPGRGATGASVAASRVKPPKFVRSSACAEPTCARRSRNLSRIIVVSNGVAAGPPSDGGAQGGLAARIGMVTPLRDGMNLLAKEYVAAQNPGDPGVLVLSRFAGAAEQLTDALLVNPYSVEEPSDAIGAGARHRDARWWRERYVKALLDGSTRAIAAPRLESADASGRGAARR